MNSILLAFGALDGAWIMNAMPRLEPAPTRGAGAHRRACARAPGAQRMWFDVDLCVKLAQAPADRDHISQTLDYDFVRVLIAREGRHQHHELQETLCDAIATAPLQENGVRRAWPRTKPTSTRQRICRRGAGRPNPGEAVTELHHSRPGETGLQALTLTGLAL